MRQAEAVDSKEDNAFGKDKNGYIINTTRGAIIDEKALYQALSAGYIAGASLHPTEVEPTPLTGPLLPMELFSYV